MRNIYLNDVNINEYTIEIPSITESAGDYGQLTVTEFPQVRGLNSTQFWDVTFQASPFYNASNYNTFKIRVENDGIDVFEGVIQNIDSDNESKIANVTLKSKIQKALEQKIIFASDGFVTPATVVREICSLYEIEINENTFRQSESIYNIDNVFISVFFKGEITVLEALQRIAQVGVARIYVNEQKINFEVYKIKNAAPIFTASDLITNEDEVTLYSHIKTERVEKEPIEGYRIEYANGGAGPNAAVFGTEAQQSFTLDGSYASEIRIYSLQAAIWIGDTWIDYMKRTQQRVSFKVGAEFGKTLKLNYAIQIVYRGQSFIVDIISINNNNILFSEIIGMTR
jgi:hypothetical protein